MNQDQQLPKGQTVTDDLICQMADSAGFALLSIDDTDLLSLANTESVSVKLQVVAFARALLALPH